MDAKDVMTRTVVTVSPDHSLRHAARIMLDRGISGVPVVDDDGRLVGIVTEGDLLRRSELAGPGLSSQQTETSDEKARAYVKSHSWKIGDVMSSDLVEVDEETPVARVAALMAERGIKRVPVMKGRRLVGIVSRADLLRVLIAAKIDDAASGDDAIRRSILARLREDAGVEVNNLALTVAGGLVHLSGVVKSQSERDAARVVAEGVRGVKGVFDNLSVL